MEESQLPTCTFVALQTLFNKDGKVILWHEELTNSMIDVFLSGADRKSKANVQRTNVWLSSDKQGTVELSALLDIYQ